MAGMKEALALVASPEADLFFDDLPDGGGVVRLVHGVLLEYGPDASADAIATVACWEIVKGRGESSEEAVRAELARHGFRYVAPLET